MMRSLARLAAVAAGLGIAALCAEGIIRLAAPQPALLFTRGLYVVDAAAGYRHQPGYQGFLTNSVEYYTTVRINEAGLRGPSLSEEPGRIRILVLGDSFVFGQGVDEVDSLTARLEAGLAAAGKRTQVLNAGVRGYGTDQEVRWLHAYGQRLQPAVIVLGVFLGNDLQDDATPPAQRLQEQITTRRYWHTAVSGFFYEHSHLYRAVRSALLNLSGSQRVGQLAYLRANYGVESDPARAYAVTGRALDDLSETVRSMSSEVIAVLIPDAMQIETARRSAFAQIQRSNPGLNLDLSSPNRVYAKLLGERGIRSLDLTEAFRKRSEQGAKLYFPIDGHLNRDGQQYAADLVAPEVANLLKQHEHDAGVPVAPRRSEQ